MALTPDGEKSQPSRVLSVLDVGGTLKFEHRVFSCRGICAATPRFTPRRTMAEMLRAEVDHLHRQIARAPIHGFAVPHLIVEDVFTPDMVEAIDRLWPRDQALFHPEVLGNFLFSLRRAGYDQLSDKERDFWVPFNEQLWPNLIAAVAERFSPLLSHVFGEDLLATQFSLDPDWPLTLAHTTPDYRGINVHSHFWHCPHWAFTILLYIDRDDTKSSGTALHHLGSHADESSYLGNVDELAALAMDQLSWEQMGREVPTRIANYRANRLFAMLDGPLAVHSVRTGPAGTWSEPRPTPDRWVARRRVLRSHAKVHHHPSYTHHAGKLGYAAFDPITTCAL